MRGISIEIASVLGMSVVPDVFGPEAQIIDTLSYDQIEILLPERAPALFAAKALIIKQVGESCSDRFSAVVSMPVSEAICSGHMPGFPILPLGIGGWMLSQAGEVLVAYIHASIRQQERDHSIPLVLETGPVGSKNRDFIYPGDTLLAIANLRFHRYAIYKVDTEAWLGEQQVVVVPDMTYVVMSASEFKGRYRNGAQSNASTQS